MIRWLPALTVTMLSGIAVLIGCGRRDLPSAEEMAQALEVIDKAEFAGDSITFRMPFVMGKEGWEAQLTQGESDALAKLGISRDQFDKGIDLILLDNEYRGRVIEIHKSRLRR